MEALFIGPCSQSPHQSRPRRRPAHIKRKRGAELFFKMGKRCHLNWIRERTYVPCQVHQSRHQMSTNYLRHQFSIQQLCFLLQIRFQDLPGADRDRNHLHLHRTKPCNQRGRPPMVCYPNQPGPGLEQLQQQYLLHRQLPVQRHRLQLPQRKTRSPRLRRRRTPPEPPQGVWGSLADCYPRAAPKPTSPI